MTSLALVFTLSALGIAETVYLVKKRRLAQAPICPLNENCLAVLNSKYSRLFLINNDLLGVLFYSVTSVIAAFLVIGVGPVGLWINVLRVLVFSGSVISLFFTYLQFRVIKSWCFWCLMSAVTIWLMTAILLIAKLNF